MIAYVKGELIYYNSSLAIIENNGIGYNINIPSIEALGGVRIGDQVKMFTYMNVKEDDISLYGFSSKDELELFKQLISVNGIGPKGGMGILSHLNPDQLRMAIVSADAKAISKAPGIGAKTAQRVILELKDKISIFAENDDMGDIIPSNSKNAQQENSVREEVMQALIALGFSNSDSYKAVNKVQDADKLSTEELLSQALSHIND